MENTKNTKEAFLRLNGFAEFAMAKDAENVIILARCMKQVLKN